MEPMIMLTTSFIRAPAPTSPKKRASLPMIENASSHSLKRASSPAQRKISCPSMAGFLLPETGAYTSYTRSLFMLQRCDSSLWPSSLAFVTLGRWNRQGFTCHYNSSC
jgi:hypothetical protein